jgi:hypothetical protein
MAYWNYRVIRKDEDKAGTASYQIHEVYYQENGVIDGWTETPVHPCGDTREELREDIRFFLKAFQRPVLEAKEMDGKEVLMADPEDDRINDGHYFEFLDRASVAVDYVYQFLGSHPLLRKEPRLHELYQRAEEALSDLYQEAGRMEFGRSDD